MTDVHSVELRAGELRLGLRPDLGGSVAGLWLGDTPVLRSIMRIFIIFIFGILLSVGTLSAQSKGKPAKAKTHKIVFQMVSIDTTDHNALMRQLSNIQKLAPGTKLEVVCHGPGLSILVKEKSLVQDKITALAAQKVVFVACEFTMSQKKITR